MTMQPSPWLWAFLKNYERFRPTAYSATAEERRRGIWTIGWGHTRGVKEGDTCTMGQADQWLHDDTMEACRHVNEAVTVQLTQAQFDALASLFFNCGYGRKDGIPNDLADSTLLKLLNAGDYEGAAGQFKRWDRQAGKELDGLLKRREAEAQHFRSGL